jgi:PAS domain S-box-containing protein
MFKMHGTRTQFNEKPEASVCVAIMDPAGLFEWIDPSFTEATGYRLDEVAGKSASDVLQGPHTDEVEVLRMHHCISRGLPFEADVLHYRKDGSPYRTNLRVDPVRDESGAVCRFVGVQSEISAHGESAAERGANGGQGLHGYGDFGDSMWDWNMQAGTVRLPTVWRRMLGYAEDGKEDRIEDWVERVHADDEAGMRASLQDHIDGITETYCSHYRVRCNDGTCKWVISSGRIVARDKSGQPLRMVGHYHDLAAALRGDEERLVQMERQRNVLVREVHHRIKNSLQGVAGLLRQHAIGHPHLRPILDKAISQVRTVAIVHGLEGQARDDEVVLCEMVPSIASMVESTFQTLGSIKVKVDVPQRIRVREPERVPVALVLNELIMNAAKHGADTTDECSIRVAVTWHDEIHKATICISNAGSLPAGFDFNQGMGIGTGLDLVRSLLSPEGVSLEYECADGLVQCRLELSSPAIYNPKT